MKRNTTTKRRGARDGLRGRTRGSAALLGAALLLGDAAALAEGGVWLVATHPVEDFAQWSEGFDASHAMKGEHGWRGSEVYTEAGAPNEVLVMERFDSLEAAQAFASSPGLAEAMKRAGVVGKPEIRFYESAISASP